ncbi:MAG TPA: TPM domain-containing protein [Terrimicrobiaceae bacterium]
MKPKDFLNQLDDSKIVAAIRKAEGKTSGEIRIFVTRRHLGRDDVVKRAATRFEKLGMTATRDRNAVLLYFAPRTNQFAIIGDTNANEKVGDILWREIASGIAEKLRQGLFTEAIVQGILMTSEALARHFPSRLDDRNELPNEVERD